MPHRRHLRPVFRPRHVVKRHRVPRHNVRILNAAVLFHPNRQPIRALTPRNINPSRIPLLSVIGSDPQLVVRESSALLWPVVQRQKRSPCQSGHNLEAGWVPPSRYAPPG